MRAGNVQELRVSICTVALATQANCGQYLYLVKQVKRMRAGNVQELRVSICTVALSTQKQTAASICT
jgi:hypothetical protein